MLSASIRAADLSLLLVAARMRRSNGGRTCQLCVLSAAPVLELDCSSRSRLHADWRAEVRRCGARTQVAPMKRGHIGTLFKRVQREKGRLEVQRTWRAGVRALLEEPQHVLNGGHD